MNAKFSVCWNKHPLMTPYGRNWRIAPVFLIPRHCMEVNGQLHSSAAWPLYVFGLKTGWVWLHWQSLGTCRRSKPIPLSSTPKSGYCIYWSTPAPVVGRQTPTALCYSDTISEYFIFTIFVIFKNYFFFCGTYFCVNDLCPYKVHVPSSAAVTLGHKYNFVCSIIVDDLLPRKSSWRYTK
jgi:hypothetical protein